MRGFAPLEARAAMTPRETTTAKEVSVSVISALRDALNTTDADQKRQREQLDFLLDAAKSKGEVFDNELRLSYSDPESQFIHIVGIPTYYDHGYLANVHEGADAGISSAVDTFFAGKDGAVKNGIHSLVSTAVNTILGNSSMGEQLDTKTFIALEHNSIVRVDVKFWRYNFSDKGVIGNTQNVFCYSFGRSVVDHTKVPIDVLVNLVSTEIGDDAAPEYLEKLRKIYEFQWEMDPVTAHKQYQHKNVDHAVDRGVLTPEEADAHHGAVERGDTVLAPG